MAGLFILLGTVIAVHAQTFTVIHSFSGPDGAAPVAGLTMDAAGNLYGTAQGGGYTGGSCGTGGCGTVFKLKHEGSGWIFNPLYTFTGPDGGGPSARVVIGPDGSLYGTTVAGGTANQGTVFKLSPPPSACKAALCPWTETVLYSFLGGSDGEQPLFGDLVFDQEGNIYGTTPSGGMPNCYPFNPISGCGVVYELTPSNGGWTESILYRFQGEGTNDGGVPFAGLIFDTAGNLYGTTTFGGFCLCGAVYKLTPSEGGWTESVVFTFAGQQGSEPKGGLIFDQAGNLYGVTFQGGEVYQLTPSNGAWTLNELYYFNVRQGSSAKLAMDPAGNLYGTLVSGATEVLELTPSNGHWTQTGFNGNAGTTPLGNVILDASGNVYTTAEAGGPHNYGVVFEITP